MPIYIELEGIDADVYSTRSDASDSFQFDFKTENTGDDEPVIEQTGDTGRDNSAPDDGFSSNYAQVEWTHETGPDDSSGFDWFG